MIRRLGMAALCSLGFVASASAVAAVPVSGARRLAAQSSATLEGICQVVLMVRLWLR